MSLKKLLFILIILVLLLRGIEVSGVGTRLSGASPLNSDWDGTSHLVTFLRENRFRVEIVYDWIQLLLFKPFGEYSCRIAMFISPEKPLTRVDLYAIKRLVEEYRFRVFIADEGPYTNEILRILNIDIYIDTSETVYRGIEKIFTSFIIIDNLTIPIVYGDVAVLRIHDERCKVVSSVNRYVLASLCNLENTKVVVLSDGTPFINSVMKIRNSPSRTVILELIKVLCRGVEPSKIFIAINAKGYSRKPELLKEIVKKQGTEKAFQAIFNPSRYLYSVKEMIASISRDNIAMDIAIGVITIIFLYKMTIVEKRHRE